ncbi:dynein light chain [Cyclospora cayetanensis]|uniref:Dynein light chain n=1 Tax=Cyclospora cayetanensis TaxID=88456 RepID=A0A1D3CU24_9EIME|nr:dynein light chain [Cyclospora cayetanensis]
MSEDLHGHPHSGPPDRTPAVHVMGMDASEDVLEAAVEAARRGYGSLLKNEIRLWQQLALVIKEAMEKKCSGAWHVVVGRHFGAFITHQVKCMVYLHVGQVDVLVFRHG